MLDEDTQTAPQRPETSLARPQLGLLIVHHVDPRFIGRRHRLREASSLVFGRIRGKLFPAALDHVRISRRHGIITYRDERAYIQDLGSRNGIFVNGSRISKRELQAGDVIGLDPCLILVHSITGEPRRTSHPRLLGQSDALGDILSLVERAASWPVTVLVLGESGVGKELIARELHLNSERPGPFVPVNCAGMPDGLLQSELFGHTRGAFSGAHTTRRGLVEEARGGTLFLDEIGDASAELQGSLLRLLQEGEIRPVGSDRAVRVDVRIVTATNADLARAVQQGRYREDLFSRLSRCVIRVPPLRERPEDILFLARAFAERFAGHPIRLEQSLALAFLLHSWPGNVRELESIVERLVIEQGTAEVLHTPTWLDEEMAHRLQAQRMADFEEWAWAERTAETETLAVPAPRVSTTTDEELTEALLRYQGNVTAVAKELNLGRNTVYRRVKKMGIDLEALRDQMRKEGLQARDAAPATIPPVEPIRTRRERAVVALLRARPDLSLREIFSNLGWTRSMARRVLHGLVEAGVIRRSVSEDNPTTPTYSVEPGQE